MTALLSQSHAFDGSHAELLGDIFETIAAAAEQTGVADGYRVVSNIGAPAGQSMFHVYFHVLGGRSLSWPPG